MEAEREKFRAYVEKSGLMSALTNVFVELYEETEKPIDSLEYIKKCLGAKSIDEKQLQILQQKVKELEEENMILKEKLAKIPTEDVPKADENNSSHPPAPPSDL